MSSPLRVEHVDVVILDIPTVRPHKLAFGAISRQSPVIVRLRLSDGACGHGEAATIGGPSWNEESPESIHHALTAHLVPAVVGQDARRLEALVARMAQCCRGNLFAKSALEIALVDAVARSLDVPAWQLLGGKRHDTMPLAWTLATGDADADVAEAERMLELRRHRIFKIKIGAGDPGADVARVTTIARALGERAEVTVDVNQAWDGNTARRYLPALVDSGVRLIEQPVARWNLTALAALSTSLSGATIMADESVCSVHEALALARQDACHVFSLKVAKHGGLLATRKVAAIAEAADIGWYGGTMLETSLGSAAAAQVFSTLGDTHHGCELFGPQLLVDDIVAQPMAIRDFALQLPDGPGLGVEVIPAQLRRFDRQRAGLTPVHVDFGRPATDR